jgi:hypothetical protein
MENSHLNASDDLDIIFISFNEARSSVTLDPGGFPSKKLVNTLSERGKLAIILISGWNNVLKNDLSLLFDFCGWQQIQRNAADKMRKMKYTKSATMNLVFRRCYNYIHSLRPS